MKTMQAQEFGNNYQYNEYKKDTKKKHREFRKERKEKKNRWSSSVDM